MSDDQAGGRDPRVDEPEPLTDLASWFRAAAAGRREYAERAPQDQADVLLVQASTLDGAARVADGDVGPMWGWLPSWRWPDAWAAELPALDALRAPARPADGACCQKCGETHECGSEMPVDTDSPVTPACARRTGHGGWHCDHVRVWDQETGEGQSGDALDADEGVSGSVGARGGERDRELVAPLWIETRWPDLTESQRHLLGSVSESIEAAEDMGCGPVDVARAALRALSSSTGPDTEGGEG